VVEDFRRFGPDVVLDTILFTGRQAHALVNALRGMTDRLVVVSSADVYRNYDGFRLKPTAQPDPAPLDQNAPLRETRYPYRGSGIAFEHADDYDKILVERIGLDQPDLPATVLRLPAVYRPGDTGYRLCPYVQRMSGGRPAILLADEQARCRRTRGYVGNVAAAIVLAVTNIALGVAGAPRGIVER
jgi:nucleoside-diphosphate-sugar epimerase